jgi:phage shock protein A
MSSAASPSNITSRSTQYTILNASLERLQKNLEALEQNVETTVVQSEWTKRLLTIHSSL